MLEVVLKLSKTTYEYYYICKENWKVKSVVFINVLVDSDYFEGYVVSKMWVFCCTPLKYK